MPWFQAIYHKELAASLQQLGYSVTATKDAFEITGLHDRELIEKYSRRTTVIEDYIRSKGLTDAQTKSDAGRRTRHQKPEPMSQQELQDYWDGRLTNKERETLREVIAATTDGTPPTGPSGPSAGEAVHYASDHLFERHSAIPERRFIAEALTHGVASRDVTLEAVQQQVKQSRELLGGTFRNEKYLTTKSVHEEEQKLLDFASSGINARRPFKQGRLKFAPVIDEKTGEAHPLSKEQQNAVRRIVSGTDRVQLFLGKAGTGKSTTLREIRRHIEGSGYEFLSYAPSTNARNLLREATFENAETTQKLLADPKLQDKVHASSVMVIDEAGLIGSPDMARLFKLAEEKGARVLLTGDYSQNFAVDRGDALRVIAQNSGIKPASLSQITRQKPQGYRRAVDLVSKGQITEGVRQLDTINAIREVEAAERYLHLADEYLKAREAGTVLIVSPSHREKDQVTRVVRETLKERGEITREERPFTSLKGTGWTKAERGQLGNYAADQVVEFHQNTKGGFRKGSRWTVTTTEQGMVTLIDDQGKRGVLPLQHADRFEVYEQRELSLAKGDTVRLTKNGRTRDKHRVNVANNDLFTVAGFTSDGDLITTKGWVLSKHYSHLENGIVRTSFSSQGSTVDRVIIAQGSESYGAASKEQFYVSLSRGREEAIIITDDRENLLKSVERSGQRLSATELLDQRAREAAEAREGRMRWMARKARMAMNEAADAARKAADVAKERSKSWVDRVQRQRMTRTYTPR